MSTSKLPITQQLVLETLAARHRTGETLFAMPATSIHAAKALSALGLVTIVDGNYPRTIRLRLTEAGINETISPTYVTPIERELAMVRGQLKELRDLRALEREFRSGPTW